LCLSVNVPAVAYTSIMGIASSFCYGLAASF